MALPRSAPRPEPRNETTGVFVSGSINSGGALKLKNHQHVREYLQAHPQWQVEWLSPYALELNPQEQVWTYLKFG